MVKRKGMIRDEGDEDSYSFTNAQFGYVYCPKREQFVHIRVCKEKCEIKDCDKRG
jgi:hypothetical protein